ncbi:hypothetical protein N7532_002656 [Penicillium argentinense]|uniref:Invertebrate defensins family profile domain-containing protein n=1 Tax=Penicillium argentinense TaxID=1131581 RepID=A0A9W9EQU6_9EURO|nr:uncharacterized protein N7532_010069 [Penicillium argentinense]XP_056470893.1 uncharacterized protein N7532_010986 [Penicillium argentinense]XP_056478122.1 uncharacterized protein N7532_002656 [Penicillium argentinense]KAJ5085298.1 hypothetical protein N7532_010069 [Penicillium argentinense]KAJ5086215.1 hypothetical protein N7532_010986 [Penicillium argentinense]KAJ5110011.1 hypothetical protein N7532_002656 [Penicillium argentinense]
MQFSTVFLGAVALFSSVAFAAPSENLRVRSSCQVGDIWGAGDAACSASCIAQGEGYHGGHCDDNSVCVCNY